MTTLFEQIKQTKKLDYQAAYQAAKQNAYSVREHADHVTFYDVVGNYIKFNKKELRS